MPIAYEEFVACIRVALPRFEHVWLNEDQERAMRAPPTPPLVIVAGPGTGKTTVLALRVLKLILVDGFEPSSIMATTFTRKAAAELRSRVLGWGYDIREKAIDLLHKRGDEEGAAALQRQEMSDVMVETLDSLAQEILSDYPPQDGVSPTAVEELTSLAVMRNSVVFSLKLAYRPLHHAHVDAVATAYLFCELQTLASQRGVERFGDLAKRGKHKYLQSFRHSLLAAPPPPPTSPRFKSRAGFSLVQSARRSATLA